MFGARVESESDNLCFLAGVLSSAGMTGAFQSQLIISLSADR